MTHTLKLSVVVALALSALSAQALTGIIFKVDIHKGKETGGVRELRGNDSRFFRITNQIASPYHFDWSCSFYGLQNPTNVSHLEISVIGSRLKSSPIKMYLFDYIAERWTDVASVELPTLGSDEYVLRIRKAPERFVSSNGRATMRFTSTLQTMIVDQITFRAVSERRR